MSKVLKNNCMPFYKGIIGIKKVIKCNLTKVSSAELASLRIPAYKHLIP